MAVTCPKCRASVTDGLFYCPYCRAYLPAAGQQKAKTIWETDAQKKPAGAAGAAPQPAKPEVWFIRCRNCGKKTILRSPGNRPLACAFCGYDYDSLLDAPQKEQPGTVPQGGGKQPSAPGGTMPAQPPVQQAGPMRRKAVPDTTVLRLRSLNTPGELFPSDRQANVIGTGGSLSPEFFRGFQGISPTHCVIQHDIGGWYIRFFDKNSQFNGQWVDVGDQMPLKDGDFITLGSNCVLQVFIDQVWRG